MDNELKEDVGLKYISPNIAHLLQLEKDMKGYKGAATTAKGKATAS